MTIGQAPETKRKRAPSKRSLETKMRVFDAAEQVFADKGFDGATIRDIAAQAGEPVGTIHHHGGGKSALFHATVARRAKVLADARLAALALVQSLGVQPEDKLERILGAFIRPFFELSAQDIRWRNYARLVAYVSSDARWRAISHDCFDPAATEFIAAIQQVLPEARRAQVAEGFVFSVSAMLALLTSTDRIAVLGQEASTIDHQIDYLIRFCAAGLLGRDDAVA